MHIWNGTFERMIDILHLEARSGRKTLAEIENGSIEA